MPLTEDQQRVRIGLAQEVHQLGDVDDAPGLIAAEQVNGPRDVWSVPFKVVRVISTFLEAQEGRDEVPPQLVATQTYQPAATDNVALVSFSKNSPVTNSHRPVAA